MKTRDYKIQVLLSMLLGTDVFLFKEHLDSFEYLTIKESGQAKVMSFEEFKGKVIELHNKFFSLKKKDIEFSSKEKCLQIGFMIIQHKGMLLK